MRVEYSSNNSGGNWWLSDEDWKALENAGWNVQWDARWLGALATSATIEVEQPQDAIDSFESVTGQRASAIGCTCCGPPHNFYYTDEDGNSHYGEPYIVETEYRFN
jgi:hypothetical protein